MKINKILEAIYSILTMIGALMVSNQWHTGWIVWTISACFGLAWAIRTRNRWIVIQNAFFVAANTIGIYNYLLSPYLSTS